MGVDILGKKANLSDSVSYQDGAIVSKEIIRKDSGTITLFAFDKGQGLSEHTVPFDAMVYIIDGRSAITIAGKESVLGSGDIIIMPAGKPHSVRAVERFKMLLVMIKK